MEGLAVFGLMGFVFALTALSRVKKVERILRENGIRPTGAGPLGGQLREKVGQTVSLTMYEDGVFDYKVLDVDEEWIHVLRNVGKKNQQEMLLRLCDVKSVQPAKT